jgi:carboxyl-terminal processing protease
LKNMKFEHFKNRFEVTENMLADLVSLAEQSGEAFDEVGFERSKPLIKNYTKAFIARSIWGNDGYYPILNEHNEIFKKAMTLFDEAAQLASRE